MGLRREAPALELVDELLECAALPADVAELLVAARARDPEGRQDLGDALGAFVRRLSPAGDAPTEAAAAEAWQALATALDRLFGSGVRQLGRLPFITDTLLDALREEARRQLPEQREGTRPAPGAAGRMLAGLAVSPKLRDAVSNAFGCSVTPTYDAVYLFDPPRSHVRTHVDTRDYELVVHLILEHTLPRDASSGSALVVYLAGEPRSMRLPVAPGEAVALRGRGTIHGWEPLRDDEHRTMTAIGFTSRT